MAFFDMSVDSVGRREDSFLPAEPFPRETRKIIVTVAIGIIAALGGLFLMMMARGVAGIRVSFSVSIFSACSGSFLFTAGLVAFAAAIYLSVRTPPPAAEEDVETDDFRDFLQTLNLLKVKERRKTHSSSATPRSLNDSGDASSPTSPRVVAFSKQPRVFTALPVQAPMPSSPSSSQPPARVLPSPVPIRPVSVVNNPLTASSISSSSSDAVSIPQTFVSVPLDSLAFSVPAPQPLPEVSLPPPPTPPLPLSENQNESSSAVTIVSNSATIPQTLAPPVPTVVEVVNSNPIVPRLHLESVSVSTDKPVVAQFCITEKDLEKIQTRIVEPIFKSLKDFLQALIECEFYAPHEVSNDRPASLQSRLDSLEMAMREIKENFNCLKVSSIMENVRNCQNKNEIKEYYLKLLKEEIGDILSRFQGFFDKSNIDNYTGNAFKVWDGISFLSKAKKQKTLPIKAYFLGGERSRNKLGGVEGEKAEVLKNMPTLNPEDTSDNAEREYENFFRAFFYVGYYGFLTYDKFYHILAMDVDIDKKEGWFGRHPVISDHEREERGIFINWKRYIAECNKMISPEGYSIAVQDVFIKMANRLRKETKGKKLDLLANVDSNKCHFPNLSHSRPSTLQAPVQPTAPLIPPSTNPLLSNSSSSSSSSSSTSSISVGTQLSAFVPLKKNDLNIGHSLSSSALASSSLSQGASSVNLTVDLPVSREKSISIDGVDVAPLPLSSVLPLSPGSEQRNEPGAASPGSSNSEGSGSAAYIATASVASEPRAQHSNNQEQRKDPAIVSTRIASEGSESMHSVASSVGSAPQASSHNEQRIKSESESDEDDRVVYTATVTVQPQSEQNNGPSAASPATTAEGDVSVAPTAAEPVPQLASTHEEEEEEEPVETSPQAESEGSISDNYSNVSTPHGEGTTPETVTSTATAPNALAKQDAVVSFTSTAPTSTSSGQTSSGWGSYLNWGTVRRLSGSFLSLWRG